VVRLPVLREWMVGSDGSVRELEWMLFEVVEASHTESEAEQVWMLGVQEGVSVPDMNADFEEVAGYRDYRGRMKEWPVLLI
jgi:hypothetical protein